MGKGRIFLGIEVNKRRCRYINGDSAAYSTRLHENIITRDAPGAVSLHRVWWRKVSIILTCLPQVKTTNLYYTAWICWSPYECDASLAGTFMTTETKLFMLTVREGEPALSGILLPIVSSNGTAKRCRPYNYHFLPTHSFTHAMGVCCIHKPWNR
jgi:hypothetical protein